MTQKTFKIVSIGEAMVEMSRRLDGGWQLGFAGDTLNSAYYLKMKLGQRAAVSYVSCLGDDVYSQQMLDFIEQKGIDTKNIRLLAGKRPGLYLIHQDKGDRQFTYWRENSAARHLADEPDWLQAACEGADLIYFSGITLGILAPARRDLFLSLLERMKAKDKIICFDPNIRLALWPDVQALRLALVRAAALCDIVLPTYGDESCLFDDRTPPHMAQRYLGYGAGEVVVKNGAAPALVLTQTTAVSLAPTPVTNILDATGAGDSFNGAYLAARLIGVVPSEALGIGHEMAGQVIRYSGAILDINLDKNVKD